MVKQTPLAEKIANSILKSVLKYDKHPSVTALRNLSTRSHFEFSFFSVDEVLKKILRYLKKFRNLILAKLHTAPMFL